MGQLPISPTAYRQERFSFCKKNGVHNWRLEVQMSLGACCDQQDNVFSFLADVSLNTDPHSSATRVKFAEALTKKKKEPLKIEMLATRIILELAERKKMVRKKTSKKIDCTLVVPRPRHTYRSLS